MGAEHTPVVPDSDTRWHQFDEARHLMMRRFAEALDHAPQPRKDLQGEIDATQRAMASLLAMSVSAEVEQVGRHS